MQIEIVQNGRVLRHYNHDGQIYAEAPPSGEYQIRLTNNCPRRRLAVLSVDGVNVVDGETAGYAGTGYVLTPWQTATIKGWRRTDSEVAAFQFKADSQSYAAKTGKGTKNTGVIGIAVYDEKLPVYQGPISTTTTTTTTQWTKSGGVRNGPGYYANMNTIGSASGGGPTFQADSSRGATFDSMDLNREVEESSTMDMGLDGDGEDDGFVCCAASPMPVSAGGESILRGQTLSKSPLRSRRVTKNSATPNLGTGYGAKTTMYTSDTEFERATEAPALVVTLRYGVRAKLREWGVPIPAHNPVPDAFPASPGASVKAPPGWRG